MRLVCPNCSAQYEVPDNVIPEGGRDVQCSNCGHTWFQRHPDDDPELAEELNAPLPEDSWEPDVPEEEDEGLEEEPGGVPDLGQPAPRRGIDPSVAEILREEAEREARARAQQVEPLESQPELGLDEPYEESEEERRARQARDRMARMRGEDPDMAAAVAAAAAAGSRRDLLPDIDEINSTLRAAGDRGRDRDLEDDGDDGLAYEPAGPRRGGFRSGFVLALFIAIVLIALYVIAPIITAAIPAAEPALGAYVAAIDGLRAALNGLVAKGLGALSAMGQDAGS